MKDQYRLVYNGQITDSEQEKLAIISILNKEFNIGKDLEVDQLIENPPFILKMSKNKKELEQDSEKLKQAGANIQIIQTAKNAQRLAKNIEKEFIGLGIGSCKNSNQKVKTSINTFYKSYTKNLNQILASIDTQIVENLCQELLSARKRKSQIIFIGNGGSAAAASHFATDLAKQHFDDEDSLFRVLSLADNLPWFSAAANDFGYENVFVQQLKTVLQPEDILIAISSSGNSPNIIKGVEYANIKGARTFGVVGFDGGKLMKSANASIYIPTKKGQYGYMEDATSILIHILSIYLYELDAAGKNSIK